MRAIRALIRFCADDQGVGSIYMLLLLPLFLALVGLGMDGAAAFRTRDMLQSTADASAIAAALKLPVKGPADAFHKNNAAAAAFTYAKLNMTVAGFGNVLNVNAVNNDDIRFGSWDGTTFTSPAPNGSNENAIEVTVKTATANNNPYPTSFLALIGKTSWDIAAQAVAMVGVPKPICVITVSDFTDHAGSKVDLGGCIVASSGDMRCTGNPAGAVQPDFGIAVGNNDGCGVTQFSGQAPTPDPYAALAGNIPANPCNPTVQVASYPQEPAAKKDPALPAGNTWPAGQQWPTNVKVVNGVHVMCGDVQLTGNVSFNTSETLVIENGRLDLGSNRLSTTGGGALSIIFTGPNIGGFNPLHTVTGTGTLAITAPSGGVWDAIAIYQDPSLPASTITFSNGGSADWAIAGTAYLPNSSLIFNGSFNTAVPSCLTLFAHDITINGNGGILTRSACPNSPISLLPISRLVQ